MATGRVTELSRLEGRVALVTGAAGAIGQIVSETLAELGADLVLVDRPGAAWGDLPDRLAARSPRVRIETCDLEHEAARAALVAAVTAGTGVDILVNNAAFVGTDRLEGWTGPLESQSLETWRRAMEVNLTAPFHLCQGLAASLGREGRGVILNMSSIYGEWAPDPRLYVGTDMGMPAAYAASKAGLIQLSRWLSTMLAPQVRVNTLSPGGVERRQPEVFITRYAARTPLGRMATEDDLRGAVAYLCSDLSRYVTGQNLVVDGGWGTW